MLSDAWGNAVSAVKNSKKLRFSTAVQHLFLPLLLLCVLFMGATGFIPVIFLGRPMAGYTLMLHVAIAPLFSLCAVVMSLIWPYTHRFDAGDWDYVRSMVQRKRSRKRKSNRAGAFYRRFLFWLLVILSVPLISSMLFSMYPVFGTVGQDLLLEVHRYCALLYVLAVMGYFYLTVVKRKKTL